MLLATDTPAMRSERKIAIPENFCKKILRIFVCCQRFCMAFNFEYLGSTYRVAMPKGKPVVSLTDPGGARFLEAAQAAIESAYRSALGTEYMPSAEAAEYEIARRVGVELPAPDMGTPVDGHIY